MFVRSKHKDERSERVYASEMTEKQRLWREFRLREIHKQDAVVDDGSGVKKNSDE